MPYIAVRKILLYAFKREGWLLQETLEEELIEDTDFKSSLERQDRKAQQYNRRHFTMKLGSVLKVLKEQQILEFKDRKLNGNIHKTQRLVRITNYGKSFCEYLFKKSLNSIAGSEFFDLNIVYKQFRVRTSFLRVRTCLKRIFFIFIIFAGLLVLFLYLFFQLEGILWVPKNSTISTSLLSIDLINQFVI